MRRSMTMAMPCLSLLLALALTGCGSGSASGTDTSKIPTVSFKSPAIGASIPAKYTCDGKDLAPPLEWGTVPADSNELVVLLVGFARATASESYKIESVDWAMAGINPQLHRLAAGEVPSGAHLGLAPDGRKKYSVCPSPGSRNYYQFEIFALPASVSVPAKFGNSGAFRVFNATRSSPAIAHGAFATTYTRK